MHNAAADVLVIGAGAAGLAAAGALKRRGIASTVLERGVTGQSWHDRYDGLRLNSWGLMSSLPGYRLPRRYGRWPTGEGYARYLTEYAQRLALDVRTGVEVTALARADDGWVVQAGADDVRARFVVVATGVDRIPRVPDWPGADGFEGRLLHSAEHQRAADFADQDVLVVGAGSSALEIAAQLADGEARSVRLAVRSGPLVFAREYARIPLTALYWPARFAPDRVLDLVGRLMQRAAFGDLTAYGLPAPAPGHQVSDLRHARYIPAVDGEFVAALKRGGVSVVPAVDRFERREVVLADQRRVAVDAVIAATGYQTGLSRLVGQLGVLGDDEKPSIHAGRDHPRAPGLFFIGYHFGLAALLPHLSTEAKSIAEAVAARGAVKT